MTPTLTGMTALHEGRERGYCMIPGVPGTKKALVKWGVYNEEDRNPLDSEVAAWEKQYPRIQPLMLTGKRSRLLVIDCDGLYGYITLGKRGGMPYTVTVQTPRGDFHEHYWCQYPEELGTIHNFAGGYDKDLLHDDLRGDGGLAVYPGGTNKDGVLYRFKEGLSPDDIEIAPLPAWLYDYIAAHNQTLARQETERLEVVRQMEYRRKLSGYPTRMARYAEAAKRSQLAKIEGARPGERNEQLNASAYSLARFLNEGTWSETELEQELETVAIRCGLASDPNCGLSGIRATIRSAIRAGRSNRVVLPGRGSAVLKAMARPAGEGQG